MIRAIITPVDQTITLDIPRDYIGKEVEVIAFAKNEGDVREVKQRPNISFTVLHVENDGYKFNRDEATER